MIGIVVVSHSRPLAEAAVALATSMVPAGGPVIRIAAGIDEAYGTDAAAVAEAIAAADSPDGVLVLMDIGSSVMSAQMAVEFLDPDMAGRVGLCGAPLVEGLIAAVVTAAGGAPLPQVAAEARAGLRAKQDLLEEDADIPEEPAAPAADIPTTPAIGPEEVAPDVVARDIPVTSPIGLHMRPVARLVALVTTYDADVRLANPARGSGPVDAASITDVLTLAAERGDSLRVEATGPQAREVVDAIGAFAGTGFGDLEDPDPADEP